MYGVNFGNKLGYWFGNQSLFINIFMVFEDCGRFNYIVKFNGNKVKYWL